MRDKNRIQPDAAAERLIEAIKTDCPLPMRTAHEFGFVATGDYFDNLTRLYSAEDALHTQLGAFVELTTIPDSQDEVVRYDIYLS